MRRPTNRRIKDYFKQLLKKTCKKPLDLPLSVNMECHGSSQEWVLFFSLLLSVLQASIPPVVVAIVM